MPSSRNAELFINGDYTQTATGLLDVTLTPQHDISTSQYKTALDITGKATLDGTLNLRRKDNFIPDVGKSFSLMKWQEVQGRFSKMTGQDINGDRFSAWFTRNDHLEAVTIAKPVNTGGTRSSGGGGSGLNLFWLQVTAALQTLI